MGFGGGGRYPHPSTNQPTAASDCFTIKHYASSVEYNVKGFREKNLDTLPTTLLRVPWEHARCHEPGGRMAATLSNGSLTPRQVMCGSSNPVARPVRCPTHRLPRGP